MVEIKQFLFYVIVNSYKQKQPRDVTLNPEDLHQLFSPDILQSKRLINQEVQISNKDNHRWK